MKNLNEDNITQAAIARLGQTTDPRLKEIMTSLLQHLHEFAREVKLTEDEWLQGIHFLTDTGQMCTDKRQEFILLSDTLGLSMLVVAMNQRKPPGCTESTVFGPFHVDGAPLYEAGADVANGAPGEPCWVNTRLRGIDGKPVVGAHIDVWQADAEGLYDVQYADLAAHRARGMLRSDADGRCHFRTIVAQAYPVPTDGPVGRMLRATERHAWRPAHLHFRILADGYEPLTTHVFRDGDRYLDSDAVFGVRSSLIAQWERHESGPAPDGSQPGTPFYTLDFEFVLNPRH